MDGIQGDAYVANNGYQYDTPSNATFFNQCVVSIKSDIRQLRNSAEHLGKTIEDKSIFAYEACQPLLKPASEAFVVFKKFSVRAVIAATPIFKETVAGVGLGYSTGKAACLVCSVIPGLQPSVPAIQLTTCIIGGVGGFFHGVEQAVDKINDHVKKDQDKTT